jgi:hypothetical protein
MYTTNFFIALFIHLISLIIGFGAVLVVDTFGALMIFKKRSLETVRKVANVTQPLIWLGWTGMVASGIYLILVKGYVDNLTLIKIFFVFGIGVNGFFLHKIKKYLQTVQTVEDISPIFAFRIFVTSAISQVGWWGALIIGFAHRHIQHNIPWPENPWNYIAGIFFTFFLTWALGEAIIKFYKK